MCLNRCLYFRYLPANSSMSSCPPGAEGSQSLPTCYPLLPRYLNQNKASRTSDIMDRSRLLFKLSITSLHFNNIIDYENVDYKLFE